MAEQKQLSDTELDFVKTPPYLHICAYQNPYNSKSRTIPYEKYLYKSFGGLYQRGEINLASGIFTSGWPGSYQVTWSFMSANSAGDTTSIVKL